VNNVDKAIQKSLVKNIRKTEEKDLVVSLVSEINFCARNYCGANADSEEFTDLVFEGYKFVKQYYPHLAIEEIRQAFGLASAKIIQVDSNAYFGRFSLNILGNVLSAYDEYRKPKLLQLSKVETTKKMPTENEIYEKDTRRIEYLFETIIGLTESEALMHITTRDYDIMIERNIIVFKDEKTEKWQLMKDAETFVKNDLTAERETANVFQRNKIASLINALGMSQLNGDLTTKVKVKAQKLAVVRAIQSKNK
jgi:hypothetical protein